MILCIFSILVFLLTFSNLKIEINNLYISNIQKNKDFNLNVVYTFYLFNKLKWMRIKFNYEKLKNMAKKFENNKKLIKTAKKDFRWLYLKELDIIKPKLLEFNLKASIGVFDYIATSYIVSIIGSVIGLIMPHIVSEYRQDRYEYKIIPIYSNHNYYDIRLDCRFEFEIIRMIKYMLKVGKNILAKRKFI